MDAYTKYINMLPCSLFETHGYECQGDTVGHHIRSRGAGGKEKGNLVPMCYNHHAIVHSMGKLTFQYNYQVNLKLLAQELHEVFLKGNL